MWESARGGNDVLYGGDGRDRLYGDAATMSGTARGGNDVLTGGGGPDVFHFVGLFGHDKVTDFSGADGEGDTLIFLGYTAADLVIEEHDGATVVTAGDNQVTVLGGPVTQADILFA